VAGFSSNTPSFFSLLSEKDSMLMKKIQPHRAVLSIGGIVAPRINAFTVFDNLNLNLRHNRILTLTANTQVFSKASQK